ncbi:hypothetical protein [Campylobacter gastrosuis]|uniref:TPM domain-containing protein n=1 Tax=Campylobacter gastrosuis TaxID=2974576 RepID=A0ABT7HPJ9_9BACT|nr:hypothetical protein [Campylobacter gastrosuis]MDL0088845.1 hypothetical protein [Campylobacter gastrosuis]
MIRLNLKGIFFALLLSLNALFGTNFVINDDEILSQKVVSRLNLIGDELYKKSGIFVGVGVYETLGKTSLNDKFKSLNLKPPFAFLMLIKNEKKVEIFADSDTLTLFDKEAVLSPFPESGTILPILASKNGKDIYNAAILNGYADITERIAKSEQITLENAIGNANKDTLNIFRILIYGSMALVIALMIYKRKAKNG